MAFQADAFQNDAFQVEGGTNAAAGVAAGAGAANAASVDVAPNAGAASGTGSAFDATVSTSSGANADAGNAAGAGTSFGASANIQPNAGHASGTGAAGAPSASIETSAGVGSGSGSAGGPSSSVAVGPTVASGSGTAFDATVSTGASTDANAGVAAGSGSAFGASASIGTNAGAGAGSGSAGGPSSSVAVGPSTASGTGSAFDATGSSGVSASAGVAAGTGSAFGASPSVAPNAGVAAGAGHAYWPVAFDPEIRIYIDGTDYAPRVLYSSARFLSQVNGQAGNCYIRLRDPDRTIDLPTGAPILLTIGGEPVWRGFISMWERKYVFPAIDVDAFGETRFFDIQGADINVLFAKRVVFNQASPTTVAGKLYPPFQADAPVIADLVADYLDLSSDTIDTSTFVDNVADITNTQEGRAWEAGDVWGQAMQSIASLPAAIYYLRPTLVGADLVYCDVDTPSAPYAMNDVPTPGAVGYREMEILLDGSGMVNDQLAWGMGYGSQTPVFVREEDAASQAEHGLWQAGKVAYGVYKQGTIDRIANSIVYGSPSSKRGAKDDRVAVTCTTYQPGFLPSQKIDFTSQVWGFNDVLPIRKMEVTFDLPATPKYALVLSHEIDTPFNIIDPFFFDFTFPPFGPLPFPSFPPFPVEDCQCSCAADLFQRTETSTSSWGRSDGGTLWGLASGALPNPSVVPGTAYLINTASSITGTTQELYRQVLPVAENCISDTVTVTIKWSAARQFEADLPFHEETTGWVISSNLGAEVQPPPNRAYESLIVGAQTEDNDFASLVGVSMSPTDSYWALANNGTPAPNYEEPIEFIFQPDAVYAIKVFIQSNLIRAKMWDTAFAEPGSWDFSKVMSSPSVPEFIRCIYQRGFHPLETGTTTITGNTVAIHEVSIDRCMEPDVSYVMFDDFSNRTIPRVIDSEWGTASSGPTYTNLIPWAYVEDDWGILEHDTDSFSFVSAVIEPIPDTINGTFTQLMRFKFKMNRITPEGDGANELRVVWRNNPATAVLNFSYFISAEVGFSFMQISSLGAGGASGTTSDLTWIADQVYWTDIEVTNSTLKVRRWLDGDPVPTTWDIEASGSIPAINGDISIQLRPDDISEDPGTPAILSVGDIQFSNGAPGDDSPCYEIDGEPVTPTPSATPSPTGYVCEDFTRIASSVYRGSASMVAGTSRVYINGLRQRPGGLLDYTEDPPNGEIIFTGPEFPEVDDVVRVCYYIANPL